MDRVGPRRHQACRGPMIDTRTVAGQVRALGHHVEPGEQGDALIAHQIHDVAGAFRADELESQQGAQGLLGGDHCRAGEIGLAQHLGQADAAQERNEEEESAQARAPRARFEAQGANVSNRRGLRAQGLWAFVVEASGQAGEPFLAQEHAEGIDTDGLPSVGEFALDVVDGEVAFAHGDDQFADAIANGCPMRSVLHDAEEAGTHVGIVAKLVAEDAKGAAGVAEAACDFVRRQPLDEVGAQRLVLALNGVVGSEKEAGVVR